MTAWLETDDGARTIYFATPATAKKTAAICRVSLKKCAQVISRPGARDIVVDCRGQGVTGRELAEDLMNEARLAHQKRRVVLIRTESGGYPVRCDAVVAKRPKGV